MTRIRSGALWALAIALSLAMTGISFAATNLTLKWQPVTTDLNGVPYPAGTVVTYNVYGAKQGQPLVVVTTVSAPTAVRANVDAGVVLCYAVTAVIATVESAKSDPPVCVTVAAPTPSATPAAPTNLQIVPAAG